MYISLLAFNFFLRAILDTNIVKSVCDAFNDEFLYYGKSFGAKG